MFSASQVYEVKYLVDFDPLLSEIISETKYMEQLGFSVPELARNVALQVKNLVNLLKYSLRKLAHAIYRDFLQL